MSNNRIYKMKFCELYNLYVEKATKKGRTKDEVSEIVCWLSGYSPKDLDALLKTDTDVESFFVSSPCLNPNRELIKGSVCGVKIQEVQEPLMKEIRYLDKLIDELAKGKAMEKILRK